MIVGLPAQLMRRVDLAEMMESLDEREGRSTYDRMSVAVDIAVTRNHAIPESPCGAVLTTRSQIVRSSGVKREAVRGKT